MGGLSPPLFTMGEKMSVPSSLYITPYYKDPQAYEADVAQLRSDAHDAYDSSFLGDYRTVGEILSAWALNCSEAINREAKFHLVWMGHLFLEAYLNTPTDEWNSGIFPPWVDNVYRRAVMDVYNHNNNQGSWGILGAVLADIIVGKEPKLHIDRFNRHLSQSWNGGGALIHEIKRTNSGIWYEYFSLAPMLRTCQLLDIPVTILFKPLQFLWTYTSFPEAWPYKLPKGIFGKIWRWLYPCSDELELPRPVDWPANLFLEAGKGLEQSPDLYHQIVAREWKEYADLPLNHGIHIFREYCL